MDHDDHPPPPHHLRHGLHPESTSEGPHHPTVYLDQNKWSELATAVLVPERIRTDEELYAASEIIRFAADDGTILPLSSAHLLETSGLHGERRYEVGVTIASFSGGWEMRHPWNVFEQEAIEALASRMGHTTTIETDRPVITTEPNTWMQRTSSMGQGLGRRGAWSCSSPCSVLQAWSSSN